MEQHEKVQEDKASSYYSKPEHVFLKILPPRKMASGAMSESVTKSLSCAVTTTTQKCPHHSHVLCLSNIQYFKFKCNTTVPSDNVTMFVNMNMQMMVFYVLDTDFINRFLFSNVSVDSTVFS